MEPRLLCYASPNPGGYLVGIQWLWSVGRGRWIWLSRPPATTTSGSHLNLDPWGVDELTTWKFTHSIFDVAHADLQVAFRLSAHR